MIEVLKENAYNIIGDRGTFHCRISAGEYSKGHGFFKVLNNMSIKIFEGAVTRPEYLFRIIH
jgi:hypothetical protein